MSAEVGAWLGGAGGAGAVLAAARAPWTRRPGLDGRVAAYLRDLHPPSWRSDVVGSGRDEPDLSVGHLTTELVATLARRLDAVLGGAATVQHRVRLLGRGSVEQLRVEQVLWGGAALAVVLLLGAVRAAASAPLSPPALAVTALAAALGGVVARDRALSRDVERRRRRLVAEFPA
ncbi:MAG: hypothetical protein ACXV3V_10865, partial [Actinomycetes bacterium]